MNLDDLSDFLLVATHEGFAQASRASGRPKASLSRKVMQLEASLGVRLFERGGRTVRLTQEGVLLLERTNGPMREIAETASVLRDGRTQPHGLLRVSVLVATGAKPDRAVALAPVCSARSCRAATVSSV